MKKMILWMICLSLMVGAGFYSSVSALESVPRKDSPPGKVYTLTEIRKLALTNAETLDTYKTLYQKYKKEMAAEEGRLGDSYTEINDSGKEVKRYISGGELSYDYTDRLKIFNRKIDNLKKQNELAAIGKYQDILSKEIEIAKKNNDISLSQSDLIVAKKKSETGQSLKLEVDLAQANLDTKQTELHTLQTQLESLYEDMNRLIGLQKNDRYILDTDSLLTNISLDDIKLSLPKDGIAFVLKDSTEIKDLKTDVEEKKRQLAIYGKHHPPGTKDYEEKEKELDIYGLKKHLERSKNALYFSLEENHHNILVSLLSVSNMEKDMAFTRYEIGIMKAQYDVGMLSKLNFLKADNDRLDKENNLYTEILKTYQSILVYQMKVGESLIKE